MKKNQIIEDILNICKSIDNRLDDNINAPEPIDEVEVSNNLNSHGNNNINNNININNNNIDNGVPYKAFSNDTLTKINNI